MLLNQTSSLTFPGCHAWSLSRACACALMESLPACSSIPTCSHANRCLVMAFGKNWSSISTVYNSACRLQTSPLPPHIYKSTPTFPSHKFIHQLILSTHLFSFVFLKNQSLFLSLVRSNSLQPSLLCRPTSSIAIIRLLRHSIFRAQEIIARRWEIFRLAALCTIFDILGSICCKPFISMSPVFPDQKF